MGHGYMYWLHNMTSVNHYVDITEIQELQSAHLLSTFELLILVCKTDILIVNILIVIDCWSDSFVKIRIKRGWLLAVNTGKISRKIMAW